MVMKLCILFLYLQYTVADVPLFSQARVLSAIRSDLIDEASGLASSQVHPGILYIVNDYSPSNPENRIFAVQANTGNLVATITLEGIVNHDWEDIAVGRCHNNDSCIFVGDTGSGTQGHSQNTVYRLKEPTLLRTETVSHGVEKLHFRWNQRESECVMVDDVGDVYIISRVHGGSGLLVRLPFGGWNNQEVDLRTAKATAHLSLHTGHSDPRGCDISPDGKELLVKTEDDIYYWAVDNRNYFSAVTKPATKVPYHYEGWGQSVAWSWKGDGYYTVSEGIFSSIYYYQKTPRITVG